MLAAKRVKQLYKGAKPLIENKGTIRTWSWRCGRSLQARPAMT